MLLLITIVVTSTVFFSIPVLTVYLETRLSQIPGMHWAVGLSMVAIIAAALVNYLRGQEDQRISSGSYVASEE